MGTVVAPYRCVRRGEGNCGQPEIRKASQFPSYGPAWHIAVLRATILAGEASQSAPSGPETPILMRREFRVDAGPSHLEWFSPRCRTGSRVLRARTRVAVRHRPISAPGAPQPSTQSVGTGVPCAYLATCGGSAPPQKKATEADTICRPPFKWYHFESRIEKGDRRSCCPELETATGEWPAVRCRGGGGLIRSSLSAPSGVWKCRSRSARAASG